MHTPNGRRVVVDTTEAGAALPANLRSGDQVRVDGWWQSSPGQGQGDGGGVPPAHVEPLGECLSARECMRAQAVVRSGGRAGQHGQPGARAL